MPIRLSPRPLRAIRSTRVYRRVVVVLAFGTFTALVVPILSALQSLDPAGIVR